MRNLWNNMMMNLATDAGGGGGAGGAPSLFTAPIGGGSPESKQGSPSPAPGTDTKPPAGNASPSADTKGGNPSDWRATLPKELQEDASLKKFTSVDALAGAYVSAQKLIGADKIALPGKHTTPEEFRQVLHKLGLPEDAAKYDVKFKASDLEGLTSSFKEAAYKAGVLPQQAQAIADWIESQKQADSQAIQKDQETKFNNTVANLKKEWGEAYSRKLGTVTKALVDAGGTEAVEYINSIGLGADETFVKLMANLADKIYGEHHIVEGESQGGMTPKEIEAEIAKLKTSPAFLDKSHPQHKVVIDEYTALFQKRYAPVDKR